jgi:hypothetical protein
MNLLGLLRQSLKLKFWFFTTFQELLFCVPASPQPPPKEGEKYKDKNLVLWHIERNYRVINSFVFLKICEEPKFYAKSLIINLL